MEYKLFVRAYYGLDINLVEFHLKDNDKVHHYFLNTQNEEDEFTECLIFNNQKTFLENRNSLLTEKLFNGKTLEEIWDQVVLDNIDELSEEELLRELEIEDDFWMNYLIDYKMGKEIDLFSFKADLIEYEQTGEVILYSGTAEFKDLDVSKDFIIYVLCPKSSHDLVIQKQHNVLVIDDYFNKFEKKEIKKATGNLAGRLKDNFSLKNNSNINEQFINAMQYEKLILTKDSGYIISVVTISVIGCAILCSFQLTTLGILLMILMWGGILGYLVNKTKKMDVLKNKLYGYGNQITNTDTINYIIEKACNNDLNNIYQELVKIDPQWQAGKPIIDEYSVFLNYYGNEDHTIDIMFDNHIVTILLDEERNEENIYYTIRYDLFANYDELEQEIIRYIIQNFKKDVN